MEKAHQSLAALMHSIRKEKGRRPSGRLELGEHRDELSFQLRHIVVPGRGGCGVLGTVGRAAGGEGLHSGLRILRGGHAYVGRQQRHIRVLRGMELRIGGDRKSVV